MSLPPSDNARPEQLSNFDPRPELRDEIYARLGLAAQYANIGRRFVEADDDAGLIYAVKSFLAYAACVGETCADLERGRSK